MNGEHPSFFNRFANFPVSPSERSPTANCQGHIVKLAKRHLNGVSTSRGFYDLTSQSQMCEVVPMADSRSKIF